MVVTDDGDICLNDVLLCRSVSINKQKISLADLIGQRYCVTLKLHDSKLSTVDMPPSSSIQGILYYYGN